PGGLSARPGLVPAGLRGEGRRGGGDHVVLPDDLERPSSRARGSGRRPRGGDRTRRGRPLDRARRALSRPAVHGGRASGVRSRGPEPGGAGGLHPRPDAGAGAAGAGVRGAVLAVVPDPMADRPGVLEGPHRPGDLDGGPRQRGGVRAGSSGMAAGAADRPALGGTAGVHEVGLGVRDQPRRREPGPRRLRDRHQVVEILV
ncbi:hypothetical protein HK102_011243, partial [Quaeritorhiza haematococci]